MLFQRVKKLIAGVKVGRAHVKISAPSHVPGVREGNSRGHLRFERGIKKSKLGAKATGARSTGINPLMRHSVVPGAPSLTPV